MSIEVPTLLVVFVLMVPVWLAFYIAFDYVWKHRVTPAIMRRFLASRGMTEADYERLTGHPLGRK